MKGNVSGTRVAEMALKDIIQNKAMKSGEEPSKSTLLMHQVRTMLSPKPGPTISRGDTTSPTDGTDDASDSIGDVSITSKDSGKISMRTIRLIFNCLCLLETMFTTGF